MRQIESKKNLFSRSGRNEKGETAQKFFWGTAVAAYQVEGNIENNDWAEASRQGKAPLAGKACDFWNRYETYLDLTKELGTNAFRFSIEWARIQPRKDEWDDTAIAHYCRMINAMIERGLEPFVTLWHFTLPQWVADNGGWANPQTIEFFSRYTERMAKALDKRVDYWLIINEPAIALSKGYLGGDWPPGYRLTFSRYFAARANLKQAIIKAAMILRKINSSAIIGSAFNIGVMEPAMIWNPLDHIATWAVRKFDDRELIAATHQSLDFIGLNYYMKFRTRTQLFPYPDVRAWVPAGKPISDLGWEIFPEGLQTILLKITDCFGKPIIVTENGIADANDSRRPEFIRSHVAALFDAKKLGANIHGYFHWSLIDNFEWMHGFAPRFGLYEMDYASLSFRKRKSATVYAAVIKEYY